MWFFEGKEFKGDIADETIGFVYQITKIDDGRKYIGKKLFRFSRTKQVKGKKKRFKIASDWKTYYGSNKKLLADVELFGSEFFRRDILHLCKSKGVCSYLETKEIILQDALLSNEYYNEWITAKISRSHLKDLTNETKTKKRKI